MSADMTPEEFGQALALLTEATTQILLLPLEAMAEYVELVESVGEDNPAFTAGRRETTAHVGRIVAAATYLRQAVAMGGRP